MHLFESRQPALWDAFIREGGIYSYLGTKDLREVERRITPVTVYPGEDELEALAAGALRVLRGEERARELEPVACGVASA